VFTSLLNGSERVLEKGGGLSLAHRKKAEELSVIETREVHPEGKGGSRIELV